MSAGLDPPCPTPYIPSLALCLSCNYPLRQLTTLRCPECGLPFDPTDHATLNLGRPLNPLARRLLAPTGSLTTLAILLPCSALLYFATYPTIYYMMLFLPFLVVFWLCLAAVIFFRFFVRAMTCDLYRQSLRPSPHDPRPRWLVILGLVTTLLVLFQVPLRVVFLLAHPTLERTLAEVRDQPNPRLSTDRNLIVYSLNATNVRRHDDVFLFFLRENSETAFAYSPHGPPAGLYNEGTHGHLAGPWYWIVED